jgi:hypothetical protein
MVSSRSSSGVRAITPKNIIKNIFRNPLRVFSYNISWESMSGTKSEWPLCSNNKDSSHPKHNSICVSNISGVIHENPADFVLLQEAADFKKLIDGSILSEMRYEVHNSAKDVLVTFWNKKYKMIDCVKGEFENGRPWMATVFQGGLCIVNIHMGHYSDRYELIMLNKMMRTITEELIGNNKIGKTRKTSNTSITTKNVKIKSKSKSKKTKKNTVHSGNKMQLLGKMMDLKLNKLMMKKMSRVIIGGDFNNDIKKLSRNGVLELGNRNYYHHPKKILTCCIKRTTHFDHVIDSQKVPLDIIIPDVHYMASDHKPILVTLAR